MIKSPGEETEALARFPICAQAGSNTDNQLPVGRCRPNDLENALQSSANTILALE